MKKIDNIADKIEQTLKTNDYKKYCSGVKNIINNSGGGDIKFINCDLYENLEKELIKYAAKSRSFYAILNPYFDIIGSTDSGYILFKYPKHKKSNPREFKKLAEELGNLRYDALSKFLKCLSEKLYKDSKANDNIGKKKLAKKLDSAAKCIENAWKICSPFTS